MNKVYLIGNVGKDPDFKAVGPKNTSLCTFSIATSEKIGESYVSTWHNIKAWGKVAEYARDNIRKGDEVFVDGKNTVESWDDQKTGQKVYRNFVQALILRVTNSRSANQGQGYPPATGQRQPQRPPVGQQQYQYQDAPWNQQQQGRSGNW